mmetsp:Transcript_135920/g.422261  ORF Transcript_135920/g.422261 Transcript_135920/m.422261 type:complete len:230 (+) Transcript_135920:329-1018(+)
MREALGLVPELLAEVDAVRSHAGVVPHQHPVADLMEQIAIQPELLLGEECRRCLLESCEALPVRPPREPDTGPRFLEPPELAALEVARRSRSLEAVVAQAGLEKTGDLLLGGGRQLITQLSLQGGRQRVEGILAHLGLSPALLDGGLLERLDLLPVDVHRKVEGGRGSLGDLVPDLWRLTDHGGVAGEGELLLGHDLVGIQSGEGTDCGGGRQESSEHCEPHGWPFDPK